MEKFTGHALTVCMLLMAFAAPLSIAATQTAWAFGLLFWLIRLAAVRGPAGKRDGSDRLITLAVLAFVGLSLVSSVFSYEPKVSLGKMMSVSLVTIAYLVAHNLTGGKNFRRVVLALLAGCVVACTYTVGERIVGKNLKVVKLSADSPLGAAGVEEGDTILTAGGVSVSSPDALGRVFAERPAVDPVPIVLYRHEAVRTYKVLPSPESATYDEAYFGILEWSRGRDTRAAGFFGHYTTFAEALQLIGSLVFALMIAFPGPTLGRYRMTLGAILGLIVVSLFLSLTRASWLSFAIAAIVITLIAASRRTVLICVAIAVPLFAGALLFLEQKRQVGFFDSTDDSTTWRMRTWKEGLNVLASEPRHLAVGIGMDSVKTQWPRWGMFDNGRQAQGHMHNDYLQLAFERGIPALIAWLAWMLLYLRLLWKKIRSNALEWPERGVLIGAFGGTIGFLTSGIVHYNWGDSEVVMIFYLIMGLSLAAVRNVEVADAH